MWIRSDQISLCVDELPGDAVCLDASLAKLGMIRWSPRLVLHLEVLAVTTACNCNCIMIRCFCFAVPY